MVEIALLLRVSCTLLLFNCKYKAEAACSDHNSCASCVDDSWICSVFSGSRCYCQWSGNRCSNGRGPNGGSTTEDHCPDDSCRYAYDGECDDGSTGGTMYCTAGTDCTDCHNCPTPGAPDNTSPIDFLEHTISCVADGAGAMIRSAKTLLTALQSVHENDIEGVCRDLVGQLTGRAAGRCSIGQLCTAMGPAAEICDAISIGVCVLSDAASNPCERNCYCLISSLLACIVTLLDNIDVFAGVWLLNQFNNNPSEQICHVIGTDLNRLSDDGIGCDANDRVDGSTCGQCVSGRSAYRDCRCSWRNSDGNCHSDCNGVDNGYSRQCGGGGGGSNSFLQSVSDNSKCTEDSDRHYDDDCCAGPGNGGCSAGYELVPGVYESGGRYRVANLGVCWDSGAVSTSAYRTACVRTDRSKCQEDSDHHFDSDCCAGLGNGHCASGYHFFTGDICWDGGDLDQVAYTTVCVPPSGHRRLETLMAHGPNNTVIHSLGGTNLRGGGNKEITVGEREKKTALQWSQEGFYKGIPASLYQIVLMAIAKEITQRPDERHMSLNEALENFEAGVSFHSKTKTQFEILFYFRNFRRFSLLLIQLLLVLQGPTIFDEQ